MPGLDALDNGDTHSADGSSVGSAAEEAIRIATEHAEQAEKTLLEAKVNTSTANRSVNTKVQGVGYEES